MGNILCGERLQVVGTVIDTRTYVLMHTVTKDVSKVYCPTVIFQQNNFQRREGFVCPFVLLFWLAPQSTDTN